MVVSDTNTTSIVTAFDNLSSVVQIATGTATGSGTLLYDGRAILTAAHVVANTSASQLSVLFSDPSLGSTYQMSVFDVAIHPDYDPVNSNNDLAIIWLEEAAPSSVNRSNISHEALTDGATVLLAGFGTTGIGSIGTTTTTDKLKTYNQFDWNSADFSQEFLQTLSWTPLEEAIWAADFDNGSSSQDLIGAWTQSPELGLGSNEGLIAPGDSGGPALINDTVVGIASYIASLTGPTGEEFDIDNQLTNSSYGEVGFWQDAYFYQEWIDTTIRERFLNAPQTPEEVSTTVIEGDGIDTSYAYFMINFNGNKDLVNGELKLEYRTVDGTAKAGEDYIATSGTAMFYDNDLQVVIPVEIIGDTLPEQNETFSLEVFNPTGAEFANGVTTLTATRTILNDDSAILPTQSLNLDQQNAGSSLDLSSAQYTLTDSVDLYSQTTLVNFSSDDSITIDFAAETTLNSAFSTSGTDITLSYYKNSVLTQITFKEINPNNQIINSIDSFNALDVGNISLSNERPHDQLDLAGLDLEWIKNDNLEPYSAIGLIRSFDSNSPTGTYSSGSGVLISPIHVLTNSHVVLNDAGNFGGYIDFFAGMNGDRPQTNSFTDSNYVYAQSNSIETINNNTWPDNDIAIIRLDTPIGDQVGYHPLYSTTEDQLNGENVFWAGYPSGGLEQDNPTTTWDDQYLWQAEGTVFDYSDSDYFNASTGESFYGGDGAIWFSESVAGAPGASGSPVFHEINDTPYIIGVYSGSLGDTPVAANIDNDTFNWIRDIVENDGYSLNFIA